jgi:hypothetical protein
MEAEIISEMLEALADEDTARRTRKHIRTIRGIRGTSMGEVARTATAAWTEDPPKLPQDAEELSTLFATAFEDGLVAIGLLATLTTDSPKIVLELGQDWLSRIDDLPTADSLGWFVLGPACLAAGIRMKDIVKRFKQHGRPEVRRATIAMGLAALPVKTEGPASAPLRAKHAIPVLQFVSEPQSDQVSEICDAYIHDAAPAVQKALRRLIREWVKVAPEDAIAWSSQLNAPLPKLLRTEIKRAQRKAT